VKAIQELRARKDGHVVTVGIGGPTGSGKTSLAEKVASVLGCVVIVSMEDYRTGAGGDDGNSDIDAIDFEALARNLQDLVKGKDTMVPLVDFQEKKRTGWRQLKISSSGVVQYLSNACYTIIKSSPILHLLIQVILLGDCRWCVCSAFNTKIIT
jgi:type IV secretory pathway VirJ component